MEKPQADADQLPDVIEIDMMDYLNLDGDGEGDSPRKDSTKGEQHPSVGADVDQFAMDVDLEGLPSVQDQGKDKQSAAMDVDITGTPPVEDEKQSSPDLSMEVPVDFNVASLEKFCKEASRSFFSEIGLVSHQINSYNDFISHGLQDLLDSFGEVTVDPDYDPSNNDKFDARKHATIKFGKVKLEEPVFRVENSDLEMQDLKLKPRHALLQKMTYSSRMNVEITVQVRMLLVLLFMLHVN
jgi:hypothetical protein